MPLSDICNIQISLASAGVLAEGFGVPLILSHTAAWVERVRYYSTPAGVLADFAATTSEYLSAVALFSQQVSPSRIGIGRAVNKPTQSFTISPHVVSNSTKYSVRIGSTTYDYTSDSSATNDEIVAGLATAMGTISGLSITQPGSAGSTTLKLTASTAGAWWAVEAMLPGVLLDIVQDHAAPDLATDLAAIANESDQWYELCTNYNSKLYVMAAAAWIEANQRLYIPRSCDSACQSVAKATPASDVAWALQNAAYARTAAVYHPATDGFIDAGWAGVCLPMDPGSETWKFKRVAGVAGYTLSTTQETNLRDKACNFTTSIKGQTITVEGKVAAGEFIDVIRFRDWLRARMGERIYARLINAKKIAFTDGGIAIIENEVRGQLQDGITAGGLTNDPKPTVTVPKASAASTANRTARNLAGVTFTATLAGAIHSLTITGVISA